MVKCVIGFPVSRPVHTGGGLTSDCTRAGDVLPDAMRSDRPLIAHVDLLTRRRKLCLFWCMLGFSFDRDVHLVLSASVPLLDRVIDHHTTFRRLRRALQILGRS